MEIIEEKKFKIRTNKNNELDLFLRNYNNEELSITLFNSNKLFLNKYELKYNLEEFQKNRFFKIFNNIDELILELDSKIEKTTILEETNLLVFILNFLSLIFSIFYI